MKIFADFNKVTGKIRPMHGVGQPPTGTKASKSTWMHYMKEAGIPFSRLHDVGGMYGQNIFVDIPNVFRDFDADEPADIREDRLERYCFEDIYDYSEWLEDHYDAE